jgi:L-ascorbate metabolism protein UlaG (beta-lactamase superfamily)
LFSVAGVFKKLPFPDICPRVYILISLASSPCQQVFINLEVLWFFGGNVLAKLTWYGHAAFKIEIAGKILLIDPMLNQNPNSPIKAQDIQKTDAVYVTHDHPDHLGDAFDICKRTGAVFAAVYELSLLASENDVKNTASLNVGGSVNFGDVKLTVVQAVHSASRGTPTGVVVEGEGLTVYHAGDTALFGDMRLFGERYNIDLACIPVGGNYTMDADQAIEAVLMLKPRVVFPMHFGTFPLLAKTANAFISGVRSRAPSVKVLELKPGESYTLAPRRMLTA